MHESGMLAPLGHSARGLLYPRFGSSTREETMRIHRRKGGVTLIEIAVILAIAGILAALAVPLLQDTRSTLRVKRAARDLADILLLARGEAIRTSTNHIVFFWLDAQGNALVDPAGNRAAAALISDNDADGVFDPGELVQWVPADPALAWGVGPAGPIGTPPGDPDPNNTFTLGWTFHDTANNPTQWVVFNPDGIPRGFSIAPFNDGGAAGVGTGNGGAYVTDGRHDYAVVLNALGGVRVHTFDPSLNAWRN